MSFLLILKKELEAVFKNSTILLILFGGSVLYAFLYPMPYKSDVITKQKIAIIDEDKTQSSRDLIFYFKSTPQLDVIGQVDSRIQAKRMLEKNEILAYVFIPKDFERDLARRVNIQIEYNINASYFSAYGAIVEGLNNAVWAFSDELKVKHKLESQGIALQTQLLKKDSIPLFNPNLGYMNYALAAILVFILHQISIGAIMLLGTFQNQENDPKAYYNQASCIKILFARYIVLGSISVVLYLLFFGFFFSFYHIHTTANWLDFWCFGLALIFASLSLGNFLSLFIRDMKVPMQIVLISSLPIVFLLGFIWPKDLIPPFLDILAHLIPAYHGVIGFLKINQMGADFSDIRENFFWLISLGFLLSLLWIYGKMKQREKF